MFSLASWLPTKREPKRPTGSRVSAGLWPQGTFPKKTKPKKKTRAGFAVTGHGGWEAVMPSATRAATRTGGGREAPRANWESVKWPQTPAQQGPKHEESGNAS